MNGKEIALIAGAALLLILITSSSANASTDIDMDGLANQFGAERVQRLQSLINAMSAAGMSPMQIKFALAQCLQETGLFTDSWNTHATDVLNNYAGISNSDGSLKAYTSIPAFVSDYIRVLSLPNNYPIQANSISDFNTRLKANGYYTDSAVTYGNNLNYYFNLLG